VLEKVIYKRLYSHLENNNLLLKSQYGFRTGYNTGYVTGDLISNIITTNNNKQTCVGLFLDLSKAFNCVNHNRLLKILDIYGINGQSNL